jgi:hypothetical protein
MDANREKPVIGGYGKHRRWMGVSYLLLAAGQAVATALGRDDDYLLAVMFGLLGLGWMVLPVTEIISTGARLATVRPWRRRILWSDVSAVLKPQTWDANRWPQLQMTDGELVPLKNVSLEQATGIAKLAGVPVEIAKSTSPPMPQRNPTPRSQAVPDPDRPLTDSELGRRFANAAERNRMLQRQLRHSTGE